MLAHDIEKFLQKTPFFRLLLALVCGIVFQVVVGFYFSVFIITFLLGIALIAGGFFYKKVFHLRWIFGLGVSLWLFSLGLFLTQKADESTQFSYIGEQHTYLAKIVSPPSEKARSVLCKLHLISNLDDGKQLNNRVLVYLAKDSLSLSLQAGEQILINAAFEKPRSFGNPYEFDYPRFLKHKGISATSYVPAGNWQKTTDAPPFSIVNLAMKSRNKLLSIYKELGISGDEYSVLASISLGYREELSRDLRESYAAAGVVHVLAVSGMHVGIIFLVVNYLLSFMDRKRGTRIAKSLIIIAFLWFYAFITGLPPSAIRATFMLSFVVLSKVMNSRSNTYNNVYAAAFFMLIYNPYYLFDLGFQFSYLAVLGIVYFQPKFMNLWKPENKILKPLWSLLAVSLAAQLTTTPISLYYFNYFPNYFWASNIVVVPAISWIIYLAFGLLFSSPIPYLSDIVAFLTTWTIRIINEFIIFIHRLPYSVTADVWVESWQMAAVYLAIALFTIAAVYRHRKAMVAGLMLVTMLFSANVYANHQTATAGNKLIVSSMQDGFGVSFVNGATSYLLTDNENEAARALSPYFMKHKISKPILLDGASDDGFVSFGEKRILILSENIFDKKIAEQPLELDYLILTNNLRISMVELTTFVTPKQVIIDQSYRKWSVERIKSDCTELGINCYVIEDEGAFIAQW